MRIKISQMLYGYHDIFRHEIINIEFMQGRALDTYVQKYHFVQYIQELITLF